MVRVMPGVPDRDIQEQNAHLCLGVTIQQTIAAITNLVKFFGNLLAVNDGYIETFVKDTHSVDNAGAAVQRILISNNVTQGLKSMSIELKDRELCNYLPNELALRGINTDQLSIMRKNRANAKEYLNMRAGPVLTRKLTRLG